MPHQDLEGTPTDRELELAHGLATGELYVWLIVCSLEDEDYPHRVYVGGLTPKFSWFLLVKKPYKGCMIDVWALPMYAELGPGTFEKWESNRIGSVTPEGERHGRLVVMLTERPLHKRIHFLASQWEDVLLARDIVDLGFCPECARLLPHQVIDKELFLAEPCHQLIDGHCPACGWRT